MPASGMLNLIESADLPPTFCLKRGRVIAIGSVVSLVILSAWCFWDAYYWIQLYAAERFSACGTVRLNVKSHTYVTQWWQPLAGIGIGSIGWKGHCYRMLLRLGMLVPVICALTTLGFVLFF